MASTFTGETATFAFVVFTTNLLQQTLVDIDTHLLPRGRSRGATFLGLVLLGLASVVQADPARWGWGLLGSLLCWSVFRVLQSLSRGDLGGGDVSFAVLIGLHLGWVAIGNVLLFVLVTFVLGGAAGAVALLSGRGRRHHLPFGPWMAVAAVLTVTFEQQLRAVVLG
jgi:prepilin signal peptidase PulO-like enzyme (type II secretory pathway)